MYRSVWASRELEDKKDWDTGRTHTPPNVSSLGSVNKNNKNHSIFRFFFLVKTKTLLLLSLRFQDSRRALLCSLSARNLSIRFRAMHRAHSKLFLFRTQRYFCVCKSLTKEIIEKQNIIYASIHILLFILWTLKLLPFVKWPLCVRWNNILKQ